MGNVASEVPTETTRDIMDTTVHIMDHNHLARMEFVHQHAEDLPPGTFAAGTQWPARLQRACSRQLNQRREAAATAVQRSGRSVQFLRTMREEERSWCDWKNQQSRSEVQRG